MHCPEQAQFSSLGSRRHSSCEARAVQRAVCGLAGLTLGRFALVCSPANCAPSLPREVGVMGASTTAGSTAMTLPQTAGPGTVAPQLDSLPAATWIRPSTWVSVPHPVAVGLNNARSVACHGMPPAVLPPTIWLLCSNLALHLVGFHAPQPADHLSRVLHVQCVISLGCNAGCTCPSGQCVDGKCSDVPTVRAHHLWSRLADLQLLFYM